MKFERYIFQNQACDSFTASNPSFCGLFSNKNKVTFPKDKIIPLIDDSEECCEKIGEVVDNYPQKWLKRLNKKGYKIIVAPGIDDISLFHGGACIKRKNKLSSTYFDKKPNKSFFAFSDKLIHTPNYEYVINKELSYGIVQELKLDKDKKLNKFLMEDMDSISKEKKLAKFGDTKKEEVLKFIFNDKFKLNSQKVIARTMALGMTDGLKDRKELVNYVLPKFSSAVYSLVQKAR